MPSWLVSFGVRSQLLYSALLRLLTMFEIKVFKTSTVLSLHLLFSHFPQVWLIKLDMNLLEKDFLISQNKLRPVTFFSSILLRHWLYNFPRKDTQRLLCLVYFLSLSTVPSLIIFFRILNIRIFTKFFINKGLSTTLRMEI